MAGGVAGASGPAGGHQTPLACQPAPTRQALGPAAIRRAPLQAAGKFKCRWWGEALEVSPCLPPASGAVLRTSPPFRSHPLMPFPHALDVQELTVQSESAPLPSPALMHDFCKARIIKQLPRGLQTVLLDTVTRLETAPAGSLRAGAHTDDGGSTGDCGSTCSNSASASGVRVHLASGAVLRARAVVYTAACRRPILPAWVKELAQGQAGSASAAAAGSPEAAGAAAQAAATTFGSGSDGGSAFHLHVTQLPAGIATWDRVDLSSADVAGKRVVVVGGGMAAAALAVGAATWGASAVTLVCRRPLQQQAFEVPVSWWGNKQLNDYRQLEDPGLRVKACRRALRQATLDLPTWHRLAAEVATGRVAVVEGWGVAAAQGGAAGQPSAADGAQEGGWLLQLCLQKAARSAVLAAKGPSASANTPFQQAVAATATAAAAAAAATAAAGAAAPSAAAAAALGTEQAAAPLQPLGSSSARAPLLLQADLVWVSCGAAFSLAANPLLAQLQEQRPTAVAGGYPWVDEEQLCWPGAPVYLAGRAALLALGPCAGELVCCTALLPVLPPNIHSANHELAALRSFTLPIPSGPHARTTIAGHSRCHLARRRAGGHAAGGRQGGQVAGPAGLCRCARVGDRPAEAAGGGGRGCRRGGSGGSGAAGGGGCDVGGGTAQGERAIERAPADSSWDVGAALGRWCQHSCRVPCCWNPPPNPPPS